MPKTTNTKDIPRNNLKIIRESRGLTQDKLAEMIGTEKSEISAIENRRRTISGKRIESLKNALNCSVWELFGAEGAEDLSTNIDNELLNEIMSFIKSYLKKKNIKTTQEQFSQATLALYLDSKSQTQQGTKFVDTSKIDNIILLKDIKS